MTVKSNFKLDKRIKSINDIQSIICNGYGFIGCKGFVFDNFVQAKDLTKCKYGTLVDIDVNDGDDHCFKIRDENGNDLVGYYRFFIPEKLLKPIEKKYRAFTLAELLGQYKFGDVVLYRLKGCEVVEHSMLIGFQSSPDEDIPGNGYVLIGYCRYGLKELFNNYELNYRNKWQPFGIEVKEE